VSQIKRHLALASIIVVLMAMARAKAQSPNSAPEAFTKRHEELRAQNPEALTLTLKLKDNKVQFHMGEIIRLELGFSSTLPDTYVIDTASYDRSGRLDIDDFVLDQKDGVVDPLHDYYSGGLFSFMGGGLYGILALEKKAHLINYDLNEWCRFDKPGKYRLYVVSGRITKGKPYHSGNKAVSPASNIVDFEILPADQRWEQQTLSEALKAVDSRVKANPNANEDPRRDSCRVLRFLGTEGAIKESIRRFRGQDRDCDYEYDFGLLGTPRRAFAVAQMEAALDAPNQRITGSFLSTLSFLSYLLENPSPLPPYPTNNETEQKVWQLQIAERHRAYDDIVQRYVGRLAISVKQKQGSASAVTLNTLIDFQTRSNSTSDDARRRELAASLAKVFLDLPLDMQQSLLDYRWKQIADPAMLPILRQLYQHPPDMHVLPQPFPGLALQRVYELAPEEGRQLILDEIRRPQLRVSSRVLGSLPDKELPQVEDAIVARAINPSDGFNQEETALALVNRYASVAALPRLRVAFENRIGNMACLSQESLLSYFLRSDEGFGIEMLRAALNAREQTRCYATALTTAATNRMSPALKHLALEVLEDKNEDVMGQAAEVLGKFGDATNKDRVKARIKQQLTQWREEKRDLDAAISSSNFVHVGSFAEMLLNHYTHALVWFVDKDELKEVEGLCLNEQCRGQVKEWASHWGTEIMFENSVAENGEPKFSVGQYEGLSLSELKNKLFQFPKETTFTWHSQISGRGNEEQFFAELRHYLEGREMKLAKAEEPKN
jgi:hypothetical protein